MSPDGRDRHSMWTDLRSAEPRVLTRLGVSLAALVLLAGLAPLAAWGWARLISDSYVRDRHMTVAYVAALIFWLALLWLFWSGVRNGRFLIGAVVQTAIIAGALIGVGVLIDEVVRRDSELLIFGVVLLGIGAAILTWVSALSRLLRGRPVLTPRNEVAVHCPTCGYSLIGLRELRCPECGATFTIDELIRAQGYGRADAGETPSRATATR